MSKKTMNLIAAVTLCGGVRPKDGELQSHTAEPGTELTPAIIAKLGLDDEGVAKLLERGSIAEVEVRAAAAEAPAKPAQAAAQ